MNFFTQTQAAYKNISSSELEQIIKLKSMYKEHKLALAEILLSKRQRIIFRRY